MREEEQKGQEEDCPWGYPHMYHNQLEDVDPQLSSWTVRSSVHKENLCGRREYGERV